MKFSIKTILFISLLSFLATNAFSQGKNMGIGTPFPHPSAIVHLGDDQGKGLKIPYTDTNAVIAYANSFTPPLPIANGLLIFQKGAETFYYYDAPKNKWIALSGITGPTGARGPTGITGPTGLVGFGTDIRYGDGNPTTKPRDTCGDYYIDMRNAFVYKFRCPGGWGFPLAGSFKSKILGGETIHLSSTYTRGVESSPGTTIMIPIKGLVYTVVAPPGYTAMAWINAYGSVSKEQVNDEYNWAKFDIYIGSPAIAQQKWQVVSMGPTGPTPYNHQDIVKWSISFAIDLGNGKRIEMFGGQKVGTINGLGAITLAGNPGSDEEAHMDIMVVYIKN